MRTRTRAALALATALTLMVGAACGGDDGDASSDEGDEASGEPVELSIVGFAVPEAANKAIADAWNETPEGEDVSSRRPTAPRATRAGPSKAASRPTTSTSRWPAT